MDINYLLNNSASVSMKKYTTREKRGVKVIVIINKLNYDKIITFDSTESASKALRPSSQRNYLQNSFYTAKKHNSKEILRFKESDLGDCFVMRESTYKRFKTCIYHENSN